MSLDTWFDNYISRFIFKNNSLAWKIDSKYNQLIAEYRIELITYD